MSQGRMITTSGGGGKKSQLDIAGTPLGTLLETFYARDVSLSQQDAREGLRVFWKGVINFWARKSL